MPSNLAAKPAFPQVPYVADAKYYRQAFRRVKAEGMAHNADRLRHLEEWIAMASIMAFVCLAALEAGDE